MKKVTFSSHPKAPQCLQSKALTLLWRVEYKATGVTQNLMTVLIIQLYIELNRFTFLCYFITLHINSCHISDILGPKATLLNLCLPYSVTCKIRPTNCVNRINFVPKMLNRRWSVCIGKNCAPHQAVLKTSGKVFSNTDSCRLANNIY